MLVFPPYILVHTLNHIRDYAAIHIPYITSVMSFVFVCLLKSRLFFPVKKMYKENKCEIVFPKACMHIQEVST